MPTLRALVSTPGPVCLLLRTVQAHCETRTNQGMADSESAPRAQDVPGLEKRKQPGLETGLGGEEPGAGERGGAGFLLERPGDAPGVQQNQTTRIEGETQTTRGDMMQYREAAHYLIGSSEVQEGDEEKALNQIIDIQESALRCILQAAASGDLSAIHWLETRDIVQFRGSKRA